MQHPTPTMFYFHVLCFSFQAKRNLKARLRGVCYSLLGMLLPLLLLATFLISTSHAALHSLLGEELMLTIDLYLVRLSLHT